AVQAQGQVLDDRVGEREPLVGEGLDEVDAAARGVHLEAVLGVGRARGEAEAAVDAGEKLLVLELGESLPARRPAGRRGGQRHGQMSPSRPPVSWTAFGLWPPSPIVRRAFGLWRGSRSTALGVLCLPIRSLRRSGPGS